MYMSYCGDLFFFYLSFINYVKKKLVRKRINRQHSGYGHRCEPIAVRKTFSDMSTTNKHELGG
jgi:hypothetical protein